MTKPREALGHIIIFFTFFLRYFLVISFLSFMVVIFSVWIGLVLLGTFKCWTKFYAVQAISTMHSALVSGGSWLGLMTPQSQRVLSPPLAFFALPSPFLAACTSSVAGLL